jgi:hypothetical protein
MLDIDSNGIIAELVSMLGQENAMRLIDIFGGTTVSIPSKDTVARAIRHACAWVDYSINKIPLDVLCVKYDMTMRRMSEIVEKWQKIQDAADSLPGRINAKEA